jgi:hypothetical protein
VDVDAEGDDERDNGAPNPKVSDPTASDVEQIDEGQYEASEGSSELLEQIFQGS